jgi:Uma2 family endonuclease
VISRTTRRRDYEFKKPFYADEVRIPEYWILDGDRRVITLVRPDMPARALTDRLTWNPPGTNASLEILLVDVFGPAE